MTSKHKVGLGIPPRPAKAHTRFSQGRQPRPQPATVPYIEKRLSNHQHDSTNVLNAKPAHLISSQAACTFGATLTKLVYSPKHLPTTKGPVL